MTTFIALPALTRQTEAASGAATAATVCKLYSAMQQSATSPDIAQESSPYDTSLGPKELSIFENFLAEVCGKECARLSSGMRRRGQLHRIYDLRERDHGYRFLLKGGPNRDAKFMRSEVRALETEALVLDLLATSQVSNSIPRRLAHDAEKHNTLSQPYLLCTYLDGVPYSAIASIPQPTTAQSYYPDTNIGLSPALQTTTMTADISSIEKSLGTQLRLITAITQPRFGDAYRVLNGGGARTWREAFLSLLESALRDGEDHLVSLPYDCIRYWISASAHNLEVITEAHLVPLGLEDESRILVDRQTGANVCGLLGWDRVVFGDIFLSSVFEGRSAEFWAGFGGQGSVISSSKGFEARSVMYTIYRSVSTIVRLHCRPRDDVDDHDARRTLNLSLNRLNGKA